MVPVLQDIETSLFFILIQNCSLFSCFMLIFLFLQF